MRLVHHGVGGWMGGKRRPNSLRGQCFRVGHQEVQRPFSDLGKDRVALLPALATAELAHREARVLHAPLLIIHQAQQRVDHHGRTATERRRQLKAQALARAGGQNHDLISDNHGICSGSIPDLCAERLHQSGDDQALIGKQIVQPKP